MKPYKIKYWLTEDGETALTDGYFDMDTVFGFYIPTRTEKEEKLGEVVNILIPDGVWAIALEPHVMKYLRERFVDNYIE